ncbi:MAG: IS66 family insertion sequence element accessory protein TnpB [Planctomycetes bacterium]|nr:IS66 family insertion sequence element accessory protein TnpB [Planctomycetota bacterium]
MAPPGADPRRVRRGRAFWKRLVGELERSGLSHKEFADRRGVSVATMRRWLYRLRQDHVETAPAILPVRVVASTAPTARDARRDDAAEVELELPGGRRLRFPTGTDVDYVAALARRLG